MLIKSKIYDEKARREKENQHSNIKLLVREFTLVEVLAQALFTNHFDRKKGAVIRFHSGLNRNHCLYHIPF